MEALIIMGLLKSDFGADPYPTFRAAVHQTHKIKLPNINNPTPIQFDNILSTDINNRRIKIVNSLFSQYKSDFSQINTSYKSSF